MSAPIFEDWLRETQPAGCVGDMQRGWNAAVAALAGQETEEPFGYFRARIDGWEDCAETDEGAVALYERPRAQGPAEPVAECAIDLYADHEGTVEAFQYLPAGTKLYTHPPAAQPVAVSVPIRMRLAAIAAECTDPDTTDALDQLLIETGVSTDAKQPVAAPATTPGPTDAEMEHMFQAAGGRWDVDHWIIEDADLHPFMRTLLAAAPAAPATPAVQQPTDRTLLDPLQDAVLSVEDYRAGFVLKAAHAALAASPAAPAPAQAQPLELAGHFLEDFGGQKGYWHQCKGPMDGITQPLYKVATAQAQPLTRQQISAIMTEHFPIDSLLTEAVDVFERAVRDVERAHGIGQPAGKGGA